MIGDGKETTLVAAAKDFFGMLPGQNIKDFLEEWKKCDDADRAEIKIGLEQNGYKIKSLVAAA